MVHTPGPSTTPANTQIRLRAMILVAATSALVFLLTHTVASRQATTPLFSEMRWRMIGPFRGGRTLTASGVPGQSNEYYFGAVGGGMSCKDIDRRETLGPL